MSLCGALAASAFASGPADARTPGSTPIDISAGTLPEAIAELSREASVSIGTDGTLPRLRTPAVRAAHSVEEALARLLAGSGYRARRVGGSAWRIERAPAGAIPQSRPAEPHHGIAPPLPPPAVIDAAPITVTAAKRALPLSELPMNLAVVRLSASNRHDPLLSTDWIAGEIEGLSQAAAGPGRNRLFLRGIADSPFSGENQATVAILLDDARLTYTAPDPGVRLVDVERVEVLKGPQGSLYGAGSLGGAYQIVTRRAVLDETGLSGSIGGQAVRDGGMGVTGSAVINLPIVPGRAALRLVGYAADDPGWVDTGARANSNSGNVRGARIGFGASLGGGWRFDATGFTQWLDVHDSQYVYAPGARRRPPQIAEPHSNDLRHGSLRLGGDAGSVQLTFSTALTFHELGDTLDATIGGPLVMDSQALVSRRKYRVWDNEARASGKLGDIAWLIGLSHVRARQIAVQSVAALFEPERFVIDDDRRDTTDSAIFADVTVPLARHVKLDLGGRLFHGRITETRSLPGNPISFAQSRTGVTPGASLSWQPHEGRLFYLRYGAASRQGGLDIRLGGQLQRLRSDELSTVELGWRERFGESGQLDVNAFSTWWDHIQSDTLLANGAIAETNAGRSRILGIEVSLARSFGKVWNLSLGGTLQNADLVRTESGLRLLNRRLPIIPDYTLRGALQRNFQIGSLSASLRGQLRYIGPARLSFDPVLDRPVGRILESRLEGHLMRGGYDLSIRIDNLFNRSADTFAFGNPLRHFASRQYTPQRPSSVAASLLKQF